MIFYCNTGSRSSGAYYAAEGAGFRGSRYFNRNLDVNSDGTYLIH